jgi:diguanylate cyclase (GGDEF)-like protein/PAS domain S-box-containing protein
MSNSERSWRFRPWRKLQSLVSPQASIIAFVGIFCLILIGHETFRIREGRFEALEDSRRDTANLARSLAQHAQDTIRTVDGVLSGMVEHLETDAKDEAGLERLRRLFQAQVTLLPQLNGLAFLDEQGVLIVGSLSATRRLSFADREYFQYHRANSDRGLYLGKPVLGKARAEWIIPVSRRIDHADGSFAGVALATVRIDYFQKLYDTFEIGNEGAILLALADGTLLVRRPFVESNIGKSILAGVIFHDHLQKGPAGSAELKSSTDGVMRMNSYRRVDAYPLVIAVAEATDEILAPWWARARSELIRAGGLMAIILVLGALLARRTRALHRQSAMLRATLDNMDQGLVVVDETGHLPIYSRRALELLDLSREFMSSRPSVADVIAYLEGRGEYHALGAEVRDRIAPREAEDVYERRRPNGTILEVRSVPFAGGGLVRTYTDVTARNLAEQELKERERLLRLLADNTTDVVARLGPDLRYAYVSPASRDVLGREPESLTGRHAGDIVHPADRGHWIETLVKAQGKANEVTQATYRALRQDGSYLWVEENRRRLTADEGFIVSIRDISRRKEAEGQLETVNRQLQVLARQDGLTGLANRREFDEVLDVEFRRCKRDGTALSLIMIDVDRFKLFNDICGHPAGDACLRAVATAVKETLLRPGDLLARYGGEELAVILPNIQAAGASVIAERMREAVRALRIRHDANFDKIVTISLGVAWLTPGFAMKRSEDLVNMADGALYAAKAGGRDRVCLADDRHDGNVALLAR